MNVRFPQASEIDRLAGWQHDYKFIDDITKEARKIEDGISMEDVEAILIAIEGCK